MSLIGSSILAGSAANQGYTIEKSLQFNGTDEHLSRTISSEGNRQTWTWSGWVKRSDLSGNQSLFSGYTNSTGTGTYSTLRFVNEGIEFLDYTNGTYNSYQYTSSATSTIVFRDPSAWYHIVCVVDTTNPASQDRVKIYVNGARITVVDYATFDLYEQGQTNDNLVHYIGTTPPSSQYFDGYLADIHFIDGQALDPNDFGEIGSTYGEWRPKKYAGTYGTNGFFLNFKGTYYEDKSGNGNDWTATNLASSDVVDDTPSNNFCTWSPIDIPDPSLNSYTLTLSDGGLVTSTGGSEGVVNNTTLATFQIPTSGKWYWEITPTNTATAAAARSSIGIMNQAAKFADGADWIYADVAGAYAYVATGQKWDSPGVDSGSLVSYGDSWTNNDVIGVAVDSDAGKIWFAKNGTWQASGDPVAGTNEAYGSLDMTEGFQPGVGYWLGCTANFGQKSFSYTPPTGYKTLCTDNLSEPTVVPGDHFNAVLYAGNGTAIGSGGLSVTGVGFQPDFVWGKRRDTAAYHGLVDAIRGGTKLLFSNSTDVETTYSEGISTFDSDGFTVGNLGNFNSSGGTYAAWNWKAGGSSTTVNTSGTISSNVSVNTSAGFSIVTYTGNATAGATVGHGLSSTPEMIIVKARDQVRSWVTYHKSVGNTGFLQLQSTTAALYTPSMWNNTSPTSSVFSLGSDPETNGNTYKFVAYCFHSVEGYSKFGTYTGNGSADGPFVYTGFRPAFVIEKITSGTGQWAMWDAKRSTYNEVDDYLTPNDNQAEYTADGIDFLSNGFKLRNTYSGLNASGSTYIYMAFAEYPFKYANARGTSYDKFTSVEDITPLTIGQSARFNADGYLVTSNNPANGNGDKWTWSGWVKQGYLNNDQWLFGAWSNTSNFTGITFNVGSGLNCYQKNAGSTVFQVRESSIYRDYGAWMHCVVAYDSDHATSSERVRLYVNGERKTNLASASYPSSSLASWMSSTGTNFNLGRSMSTGNAQYQGYLAEVNFIDNQALGPESFGYRDPTYGDWRPRSYNDFGPEVDYGGTGFRLDFQSGALGTDRSGNGQDFSLVSMSTTSDSVLDSPSNNFATANQLMLRGVGVDVSEGSLYVNRNSAGWGNIAATMGVSSGKWYWEFLNDSTAATMIGVDSELDPTDYVGSTSTGYGYYSVTGNKYNNRVSSSYGNTFTTGDIIGVALDMDNGKIWFAKNGTWQASGDPAAGTNEAFSGLTGTYLPQFSLNNSGGDGYINFGQDSSFAGNKTRQSNQDGNSIGDFYYTPPTGFLALCTSNLSTPSINPKDHFNTVTYTGDGVGGSKGHSITGVGFKPELTWIKVRDTTYSNEIYDAVRGPGRWSSTDQGDAESGAYLYANTLTSFDTDGFTLSSFIGVNDSGRPFVSWNWNAGDNTVVNSTGTISANVSANTTSGVSIATFSVPSSGSNWTIGHGLGAAPKMILQKARSTTSNWAVYHASIGETKGLYLNSSAIAFTASSLWNDTAPTSTVWTIGNALQDVSDVSAFSYLFAEVEGFSKFGKYTGNASSDGPFIYTGFRPAFVMCKSIDTSVQQWWIFDSVREGYNVDNDQLYANLNSAEGTSDILDLTSNGFKHRNSSNVCNGSGQQYVYAAFAEYPFKFTNAR